MFPLPSGGAFPDGKTILEGLPLSTTERVQFEIELDENKVSFKNQDDLRVASIENIMESFSNVSYNLKVVSKEAFDNTLCDTRVKRKLEGKISTIVADIIQNDLGSDKPVYVDPTHNSYYDFGGDMSPFSKILELQTYAIPDGMSGKSAGYLFWQTSEGFHFRSLDKLFDKKGKYIKKFIENKKPGPPPIGYDGKILQSSRIRSIDGLDQFETGSYGTILEVLIQSLKNILGRNPQLHHQKEMETSPVKNYQRFIQIFMEKQQIRSKYVKIMVDRFHTKTNRNVKLKNLQRRI